MIIGDASEGLLETASPEGGQVQGPRAGWRLALSTFVENKLAVVGAGIIVFFLLFCFIGPFLYHTNQVDTNVLNAFDSPGRGHPLGTDGNGFDELGRIMKGGQAALEIGLFASLIATVIGTLWAQWPVSWGASSMACSCASWMSCCRCRCSLSS